MKNLFKFNPIAGRPAHHTLLRGVKGQAIVLQQCTVVGMALTRPQTSPCTGWVLLDKQQPRREREADDSIYATY